MSRSVVVDVVGVVKEYHRGKIAVSALNGVDLTVGKGEVVGIVGPSGSGKTTLLNLIGGLDRPTRGRVSVDGVDLSRLDDGGLAGYRLRRVGFIFQFYNLIPTMTALENVELPLSLAGVPKLERAGRASALMETVGLGSRTGHMPDELSGGEQQRVAVARALANNPSVVLGDEPTGDLDSKSAEALMELIISLRKQREATFILVTHDPIVVAHCDRSYSVRDGRILREISTQESAGMAENQRAMMDGLY
jgi:putative ABC transport system ATP-binding protein